MKQKLTLLLCAVIIPLFVACSSAPVDEVEFTTATETELTRASGNSISPTSLTVPYTGGEYSVVISSVWPWRFAQGTSYVEFISTTGNNTYSQSGLTVLPGQGTETVKIVVGENPRGSSRTVSTVLQFSENGGFPAFYNNFTINQAANPSPIACSVTPKDIYINNKYQSLSVEITGGYDWEVVTTNLPVEADKSQGTGSGRVRLYIDQNYTGEERTISVPVKFNVGAYTYSTINIRITQGAGSVSPHNSTIPAEGGLFDFKITTSYPWYIQANYTGLVENGKVSGNGDDVVTMNFPPNFNLSPITYRIPFIFYFAMPEIEMVTVTQEGGIEIDNNTIYPSYVEVPASGGTYQFMIKTSFPWELVNPSPGYLSFDKTSGTGDTVITMTAAMNESSLPVTSQISVRLNDPNSFFPIVTTTTIVQEGAQ